MYTHTEIVDIGYKWVMTKCAFAFKELNTIEQEQPDVIGFISGFTFLLEAKVSRSDFLQDRKKPFREFQRLGMGDFRFFICPKGLIKESELPNMWGLIEVNDKGVARCVYNPFGKGNIYSNWKRNEKNIHAEYSLMYSALRRLHLRDRIKEIYQKP